jgi:hypothetical protein
MEHNVNSPQAAGNNESHIARIRNNYDTTNLRAIMGRFNEAVSWGDR